MVIYLIYCKITIFFYIFLFKKYLPSRHALAGNDPLDADMPFIEEIVTKSLLVFCNILINLSLNIIIPSPRDSVDERCRSISLPYINPVRLKTLICCLFFIPMFLMLKVKHAAGVKHE